MVLFCLARSALKKIACHHRRVSFWNSIKREEGGSAWIEKSPYKYWMNNTEMFFEIYISHPVANPDVSILLEMTYKSFIQNARIFSYDNEKKNTAPISYIPTNVFSNPMVDDIRLVTLTNCGWRIPFRCHVSLPIDKVRYIKLYVQNSAIEFGLYSKASSKNKLDAGTPVLFPLMSKYKTKRIIFLLYIPHPDPSYSGFKNIFDG